ncbi:response regulator [Natrinema versiforme]|uniref:Response regulator n=1 Tax=Natrinema versiforme TaxID=88724 RepID=A0A4P8WM18_9EURY|nr:response regulator [Natrinema versiforme]QCS43031.1 response regulator [Natrinema versiforme]
MTDSHPVEALLIDPNPEHVRIFFEALENEKIASRIHAVSSGGEALDFLHRRGEYSDAVQPNLILLDIDLPEMDGHRLLEDLIADPDLEGVPVIVLSGSNEAERVARSYELRANAYVQKPVESAAFIDIVRSFEDFWLEIVRLPPSEPEDGEHP